VRAYQFGVRLAFIQLLKTSALLPAPADIAAWRSQSDASRLRVFAGLLSLGNGALLLSYWPDGEGRGGTHAVKSNRVANNPSFINLSLSSELQFPKERNFDPLDSARILVFEALVQPIFDDARGELQRACRQSNSFTLPETRRSDPPHRRIPVPRMSQSNRILLWILRGSLSDGSSPHPNNT
jgi:hypothetical protein